MAKPGKTAAINARELDQQYTRMWTQHAPKDWVAFLESIGVNQISATGSSVKILCPYHADTNPSGIINLTGGFYKCFSCGTRRKDPISVIHKIIGSTYTEAFNHYRQYFKLSRNINKNQVAAFSEIDDTRRRMHLLSDAFHNYACSIWDADRCPETASKTRSWLQNRGIADIHAISGLGLLPREDALEKLVKQHMSYCEGDWEWQKPFLGNYLSSAYSDCLTYTYAKSPDRITAFKLRPPKADKGDTRFISLPGEEGYGAFGITHAAYAPSWASSKLDSVIIVEGEQDQVTAYYEQAKKGVFDEVYLAIGGSGHNGLDFLYELGIKKAFIVGDDDEAGEELPSGVLSKTKKVSCAVLNWSNSLKDPKGGNFDPDDAIRYHGYSNFQKIVTDPKSYTQAPTWVYNRTVAALTTVDDDDVATQENMALDCGEDLKIESEIRLFTELIAKKYSGLSIGSLQKALVASDDDEIAFIRRMTAQILQEFQLTEKRYTKNLELGMWNFASRQETTLHLGPRSAIINFKAMVGYGLLYEWVSEKIGLPDFLQKADPGQEGISTVMHIERRLEPMVLSAIIEASKTVTAGSVRRKGQGLHLDAVLEESTGYVVNGSHAYKMAWDANSRKLKAVQELPGPVDKENKFNLIPPEIISVKGWAPMICKAEDLLVKPKWSIKQCYDYTYDIINDICSFKYQEVDVQYAALRVFYLYWHTAIKYNKSHLKITGEYESGKSILMALINNHPQLPLHYRLCLAAYSLESYSPAAVKQLSNANTLGLGLDEANDPNDGSHQSTKMSKINQLLRSSGSGGSGLSAQGTPGGQAVLFHNNTPIVQAGATSLIDSMEKSRYNELDLVKDINKANSRLLLRKKHSEEFYHNLQRDTLLNAMQYASEYAYMFKDFESKLALAEGKKLSSKDNSIFKVDRQIMAVVPIAGVSQLINGDGIEFLQAFSKTRVDTKQEQIRAMPGYDIIDTVLNAPFLNVRRVDRNERCSILSLLQVPEDRHYINGTRSGVYYDEATQLLALSWTTLKHTLFATTNSTFSRQPPAVLKRRADSCADLVINPSEAKKLGALARLNHAGLASSLLFTLITVKHIIQSADDAARAVATQQVAAQSEDQTSDDPDNPLNGVGL